MDLDQLRALSATVAAGSLDAAARALHVTPSAVSQRLKALETATGQVLLVRGRPARPTASGEVLLRLARQVELLTADAVRELGGATESRPATLPIAVNADSLATWVLPALAPLAGEVALDLHVADQARTSELLRAGTVMAAVTDTADPLPGCSSTPLGSMRYRPAATAAYLARWLPDGPAAEALERAPVVVFDRTDDLQAAQLRARGVDPARPPVHHVPSSADFLHAVRLGMGWGMVPDLQDVEGDLVELGTDGAVDVTLYWQQWRLRSPSLDRVGAAVLEAAGRALRR
ncbi:ArgP/LysG family DNA-binding transcriptional regulator [Modestobacter sp. I12A-02628]|uniref:LysR family transcriptional regulator ArgP n=1 Tax=Goekera deserti TaxID=2497753 RepID=A0A7K3W8I9_9ACTN|nr:LysR family transcriptional regulator ArgP [Goekera deserti]MPR00296.1 ArgP/LysG family DNA-binding transcriptional regulator [Goekera deserti]NDI49470.1 ArgP/LysG family DNA-binding transcriptional regulator [Goekera deserti]NEL52656.1 LysR family transcriptional regulator ArgP [Goekera deserti]